MFHNKPGTMGLLCDPAHPALASFPTDPHSHWQWFHLAKNSQPLILEGIVPPTTRPIVQAIDNMERVHHLGIIFELKGGAGSLLVCATDLLAMQEHPEARQLYKSLCDYVATDAFAPTTSATPQQLHELFAATLPMPGARATASSFDPDWRRQTPQRAIDGNDYTLWVAADAAVPQWWQVTFALPEAFYGIEILWGRNGIRYTVECSSDGTAWQCYSDQRQHTFATDRHRIAKPVGNIQAVRITIAALPDQRPASIAEVRFLR